MRDGNVPESYREPSCALAPFFRKKNALSIRSLAFALCSLVIPGFSQNGISHELPEAERAHKIIDSVEEEAKSASPEVRAYVWMQLAAQRAAEGRKDEESRLLRAAYLSTLEQPERRVNTIFGLQQPILRQMMKDFGPSALEDIFPKIDGPPRAIAVELLVTHYTDDAQFDRALVWLKQAPHDGWFPFDAATRLMNKLPPQRVDDRRAIFAQVFSFCDGKTASTYPLATMIEKFWRELARADVLVAIDRVLDQASQPQPMVVRPLRSAYQEYREKFLPILRELDPARAESLERQTEPPKKTVTLPQPRVLPGLTLPIPPELQSIPTANPPVSKPVADASANLASPARKGPRVVNGCLDTEPWCRQNRMENALRATADHLKKGETDLAKLGIQRGFRLVEGERQYDSDLSDPNLAVKSSWPSTVNAEAFAVLATKISPDYALTLLSRIRDPEIRLMVRLVLARMWLGERPFFGNPGILNNEESGCECIPYYMYLSRQLFDWSY